MQYYNWYNQCPYMSQYGCVNCPAVHNPLSYFPLFPVDYSRLDIEEDLQEAADATRTHKDIERVLPIIYQRLANEINEIVRLGIDKNILDYFIREMVNYIDRNYSRYSYSLSGNITTASDEIKTRLYWIFDIMRLTGIPFELQMRLLNNLVIISMQNLRTTSSTPVQAPR